MGVKKVEIKDPLDVLKDCRIKLVSSLSNYGSENANQEVIDSTLYAIEHAPLNDIATRKVSFFLLNLLLDEINSRSHFS